MGDKQYAEEFKIETIRLIVNGGYSVAEVAARLGTTTRNLYAWKKSTGQTRPNIKCWLMNKLKFGGSRKSLNNVC
ncbi:MAG: transposase [Phycisphaeraceae bacterium]|nr:transposase [Phycisphaeraceae bacterium]